MMRGVLLFLVIIAGFDVAWGATSPCTFTNSKGEYYDLSPLADCSNNGYTVNAANTSFQINICTSVINHGCNPNQACCELRRDVIFPVGFDPVHNSDSENFGCGLSSPTKFSDLVNGSGVLLTYNGGDAGQSSQIELVCDPSATTPVISYISESASHAFLFQIRTSEACPRTPSSKQINLCPIEVFLVPHTHDDVGWLHPVDVYYQTQVRFILDSVVDALVANPDRRFIYVEQAFFYRWWTDVNTTQERKNSLQQLVKNGQFEFVLGGWTMPDEAVTTYTSIIDDYTLGHQFIYNTFGVRPTKGWQLDPFGGSSTTPTLGKLAGFDVQVVDRVTNKQQINQYQRNQFLWQGSPSLGAESQIFTEFISGTLYCDWYLNGFTFDSDPVNTSNVADYAEKFQEMANTYRQYYKTPHILAEWGCDFAFQNATAMFHSMDQVMTWLQANQDSTGIYVKYAVLSDYFDAVFAWNNGSLFQDIPRMEGGDFMPLEWGLGSDWATGFYTSRPTIKGLARHGEAVNHGIESMHAIAKLTNSSFDPDDAGIEMLFPLRMALGQATHHDAITGTSAWNVVDSYEDDIWAGINQTAIVGGVALDAILTVPFDSFRAGVQQVLQIEDGEVIAIVLFNSLAWPREEVYALPVNRNDLLVYDVTSAELPCQVNDAQYLMNNISSKYRMYFVAEVPDFGYTTVYVSAPKAGSNPICSYTPAVQKTSNFSVSSNTISIQVGNDMKIKSINNTLLGINADVSQDMRKYFSANSDAYSFAPAGESEPLFDEGTPLPETFVLSDGPLVSEIYQIFPCGSGNDSAYAQQSVKIYHLTRGINDYLDIDFVIGVLPSHAEVVTTFETSTFSKGRFVTDSNGYEFQQRQYDYNLNLGGNYLPFVYSAYIQDSMSQFTVVADRAHGCTSLRNGHFEVMLHRNADMGGPSFTDLDVIFPSLRLLLTAPSSPVVRTHAMLENFPLIPFTANAKSIGSMPSASQPFASLPLNIHLLTFAELKKSEYLVRLTHLYERDEDPILSKPVDLDLMSLFPKFTVKSIVETTLTATQIIAAPVSEITITSKEIRTFVFSV